MATPTFSGLQHLIWNFQERVVSDDFNRAEQFAASALAELLRLPLTAIALESEAEGKTTPAATAGNPLRAVVFEGIRFRPEIGTTTGFVEPGCALVVYPDASPHPADSPARLLLDPGVQSAGTLTLTAGGGGARIDVVECQPTNVVTEADSRDVFDPSTGLFSPSLVNKVARGGLTYRIRTGTAGAGFPGTASGWLPIAVCLVPSSATTWDDCTVWDVRPLLADLADPPHVVTRAFPRSSFSEGSAVEESANVWKARGLVERSLSGWKVGGDLAPAASGSDYVGLHSGAGNWEPGFAAVAERPWYLMLLQPFGLPRWSKLSPATALERTPQAPRGIPVFTQKAPNLDGEPSVAVALPTATGLGGSTTNGAVVLSGYFGTGLPLFRSTILSGGETHLMRPGIALAPTSGAGTDVVTYDLIGNVTHPTHAVSVLVVFTTKITDTALTNHLTENEVVVSDPLGKVLYTRLRTQTEATPSAGSYTSTFEVWLPLKPNLATGVAETHEVEFTFGLSGDAGPATYSLQAAYVVGWKLI